MLNDVKNSLVGNIIESENRNNTCNIASLIQQVVILSSLMKEVNILDPFAGGGPSKQATVLNQR